MGQEVDEHNLLDKKESEDYYYVKEVKKNLEPGIGSHHDLFHHGRDGLCGRRYRV